MQHLNVRGIGTEAVFGDDHLEVRVVLTQFGDQALGGVALTVVFVCAILLDDRLGHQGDHFALIGVNKSRPQHLVAIGDGAVSVMHF